MLADVLHIIYIHTEHVCDSIYIYAKPIAEKKNIALTIPQTSMPQQGLIWRL